MRLTTTPATGWRRERILEPIQVYCAPPHHQLQVERRWRILEPIKLYMRSLTLPATGGEERGESHRANSSVCAPPTHQLTGGEAERVTRAQSSVCAHHTPATMVEQAERVIEANQVYSLTNTPKPATGGEERES